jgi:arginine/lysine/ornithine decarboxylase
VCLLFGERAFEAQAYLQSKGVFAEFCDGNVVCLYFSPAVTRRTFQRVKRLVEKAFDIYPYQAKKKSDRIPACLVSQEDQVEWVELTASENRVLAANVGLFPPCVPLKKQGETMDKESIQTMQKASNVFGVQNGKVAVYKRK